MKQTRISFIYIFLIPLLIQYYGCQGTNEPEQITDEPAALLKYLEDNGDYINTVAQSVIEAEDVRTAQLNHNSGQVIIDLRNPDDFKTGHIEGAINLGLSNLYDYVNKIHSDKIVLVCYGGQTSGYASALLRLSGFNNVYSMKWGMSAWDSTFAKGAWLIRTSNARSSQFTTIPTEKPLKDTTLPIFKTYKKIPVEILNERVKQLLSEGFTPARITTDELFKNLSSHFIISYCPEEYYQDPGHIQNAVNYKPKYDLKSNTNLKKLPPDSSIVLYCFTGQSSAYAAAYLRILGYDAKFVIYGASGMIYDKLKTKNHDLFTSEKIKNYPFVKEN